MREDTSAFALLNESEVKEPRFVIQIEFEIESLYLTSHAGISGLPGVIIENVLQPPSSISQRIIPDEGRAEIGSFTFKVVDLASAFTAAIRERLQDYQGLRDHRVRFFVGYRIAPETLATGGFGTGSFGSEGFGEGDTGGTVPEASFSDFQIFQTQDITGVSFKGGIYTVKCADITRETRKEIFEPKKTTLRTSITAAAVNIPVYITTGFSPILHGASFSDAPSSMAGYIMVEDEIIRYTFLSSDGFHGCTRGVFNTKAVAHSVDSGTSNDNRPKVEEVIYLEMPAPMMAHALLTGIVILPGGATTTLPAHWHLGIDPALVRLEDFTGIGEDLWDPDDDTLGFIPAFQEVAKVDGKKFLESELYQLIGCYPAIYYDGRLGLKRMNPVLIEAAGVVELNPTNVVSWDNLDHDYKRIYNIVRVDWNYNGEEYTRSTVVIDSTSIDTHKIAPIKTLKFKGLRGWRHSDAVIRGQINTFRDRYSSPPQTFGVTVMPSLNRLEVGDIVRVKLPNVRDFAGVLTPIDRAFEIQRKSEDYATGEVSLDLFGSTGRANIIDDNAGLAPPLPDSYYTSQGTALSSVCTIVVGGGVGVIQPGTYNLTGSQNLRSANAIYYYDGELDLANAATLTINDNVQIRVKGFFTINGTIDGVGRGNAGVADTTALGQAPQTGPRGISGYIGNSRGMDGVQVHSNNQELSTRGVNLTPGKFSSFPRLALEVVGAALNGLPSDLRGTSGGSGGSVARSGSVYGVGGTGGDSGAGLAIICRGLAFGASGEIDLSGDDSASTTLVTSVPDSYPGAGGAGGPGSFLLCLDGSSSSLGLPDIGGRFLALTGSVPINGNPIKYRKYHKQVDVERPYAGFLDAALISNADYSNACHRIQYIPALNLPEQDENDIPTTPTGMTIVSSLGANSIRVVVEDLLETDAIEVYGATTNNRVDALQIAGGSQDLVSHDVPTGSVRFYWARVRRIVDGPDIFSDWYPASETDGISSAPRAVDTIDIEDDAVTTVLSISADATEITHVQQNNPDGQAFNTQIVELTYETDTDVQIFVTVSGSADYTFDAAGTFLNLRWSVQRNDGYSGAITQEWFLPDPVNGAQYQSNISFSRRYTIPANDLNVWRFMASKFQAADDVFMRNIEMRLEVIKK